jgi:hypothetical protein
MQQDIDMNIEFKRSFYEPRMVIKVAVSNSVLIVVRRND